jgi:hypothetical protein
MENKPVPHPMLLRSSDGKAIVKYSACDTEIPTQENVESVLDLMPKVAKPFRQHMRERHGEDVNQAAARVVREATGN